MRIIGLDLGTRSLGIAITDSLQILASGVENFLFAEGKENLAINKIEEIIEKYGDVEKIVLGHPIQFNGQKSSMTIFSETFYKKLKKHFKNIKIVLWDERYSTKNAISDLKNSGLKMSKIKKIKDEISAILILEDYLQNSK